MLGPESGRPIPAMTQEEISEFWSLVDDGKDMECWEWEGAWPIGYGLFRIRGVDYLAHRVAYYLCFGNVATGNLVMHSCDNPPCCNPMHLLEGTTADNNVDVIQKGRYHYAFAKGEAHHFAKLSNQDALMVFKRLAKGERQAAIARHFGVTRTIINNMVKGRIRGWMLKEGI
jgi:HNH endonuclease